MPTTSSRPRVAVIGAGPSGLYAAAALVSAESPVDVDVLDRLPVPYGLVRYGVAPDHLKMKSVIRVLRQPFSDDTGDDSARPHVRFLGNVRVGADGIPLDVLREHYHAIVVASGSSVDRALGIPGEELAGSYGSGAFVSWYCGHPDFAGLAPLLDAPHAVVVGAGNVALDVARVLTRDPAEMAGTDVPDGVLGVLRASRITDVHVVIRRGPQHVRFTPAELRQIGELTGVSVAVHDDGLLAGELPEPDDRRQRQNLAILRGWARAGAGGQSGRNGSPAPAGSNGSNGRNRPAGRRIHLHFLRSPVRLTERDGSGRVGAVVLERNEIRDDRVAGTGERETLEAGLVVRAIGYAGEPIPGLPFAGGVVPNEHGRVLCVGERVPGIYVAGWIKRGPSGVIGTNKGDAVETVAALLEDLPTLPQPPYPGPDAVLERLAAAGIEPVSWADWERIDAEEIRMGTERGGAERVKIAELRELLAVARPSVSANRTS